MQPFKEGLVKLKKQSPLQKLNNEMPITKSLQRYVAKREKGIGRLSEK